MIGPKIATLSAREEREAYELATLRDVDTCQRCHRNCGLGYTSRDHRKDRSLGGRTEVTNLVVLGGTGTTGCHGWKTENPAAALEQGWAVPGWADPASWPARRYLRTTVGTLRPAWVQYAADGTWSEISAVEAFELGRGILREVAV